MERTTIQSRLLSGRYRVEALSQHWVLWNREGICVFPDCQGTQYALHTEKLWRIYSICALPSPRPGNTCISSVNLFWSQLVCECFVSDPVEFWLDPSTMGPYIYIQPPKINCLNVLYNWSYLLLVLIGSY